MAFFVDSGFDKSLAFPASYDPVFVVSSFLAIYLGAYSGLAIVQHIKQVDSPAKRNLWLAFGSLVLGNGIFSMHFIGMLAQKLPVTTQYDLVLTILSGFPAILAAWSLLAFSEKDQKGGSLPWLGGMITGLLVVVMHTSGMLSMRLDALMLFDPLVFTLSIIVGLFLAVGAVGARRVVYTLKLPADSRLGRHLHALIIALSLFSIHYFSLLAVWVLPGDPRHSSSDLLVEPVMMGIGLVIIFFILAASSLLTLHLSHGYAGFDTQNSLWSTLFDQENVSVFRNVLLFNFALFFFITWVALFIHDAKEKSDRKQAAQFEIKRVLQVAAHDFESIISDLNFLLSSDHLAEYLIQKEALTKAKLARQFIALARERRMYDQIRLINLEGVEEVRVNSGLDGQSTLVEPSQLQNKLGRDYLRDAIALPRGQFYISRFNLNQEQGQVEEPYKPMIRFAAPVFDQEGNKQGVMVLNYLGSLLLGHIQDIFRMSQNEVYLLDKEGYLLMSPDPADQWGFMFNREPVFKDRFPLFTQLMSRRSQGEFETRNGQFIFKAITVSLREDLRPSFGKSGKEWKVVIRVGEVERSWRDLADHPIAVVITVCGIFLAFFISLFASLLLISRKNYEKKETEALRELEFQKRALDEHAIVSATDVTGRINYVNDKFVAISGYTRQELLGNTHRMVKSGEHSLSFYQNMWRTISEGKTWHGEVRNLTKEGESYWVRATIVPFLNRRGRPFKYVSIRTDVTEMKVLEARLLVAKEEAEAAGRAKSDFLANMSHEIRTPMNAIIGLSHLCLQTRLTARQKDYTRKVHSSATSLLRIINDILDFSKIDAGQLDMEATDFTLEEVLGSMAAMISLKAQEKQLEFLMETAVDIPPSLVGDPLRLGQILINLGNNAIKFTQAGEVAISTEVVARDERGVRLQFTVRDTGIGMTPEQRAGLFQPFAQADASITRQYGGTGLGLTISQRLIELMDGEIRVESEKGVGSRFIFTVQLGVSNRVVEKSLLPSSDLRGMRVLVVDDNESARNVLSDYLASFTFKVSKAVDGREAMVAVQEAEMMEEPFDLVMMDYMMPEMDGITATTKIRDELGLKQAPMIIMATAYGEEKMVKRAIAEARVDGFLVKPINQSLLFESIMEVFGKNRQEGDGGGVDFTKCEDYQSLLSGAHLLLVEDNEINQQVARELLEQANISVVLAENGKEALERLEEGAFDGILMDIQMPVMDGLTCCKKIRKDGRFVDLPILAMTANAMSGDRDLCLAAGMQDHIAKPIDPAALFSTISRWIKPANPQVTPPPAEREVKPEASPTLDIPGIDTQSGLQRVGGNEETYRRVLAKFRSNQGEMGSAIAQALDREDRLAAERHVHTLKGVSATIGAMALHERAKELESAIKGSTKEGKVENLLQDTVEELSLICETLDERLPAVEMTPPVRAIGEESLEEIQKRDRLLRKVMEQLDIFDAGVDKTLRDLRRGGGSQELMDWLETLEERVSHYDFEGAVTTLQQCMTALKVDLEVQNGE
ncbi:MAG: response regulator [Magnetococcales bacterium]|nr:response regulator [Magnetococcales bacterium]